MTVYHPKVNLANRKRPAGVSTGNTLVKTVKYSWKEIASTEPFKIGVKEVLANEPFHKDYDHWHAGIQKFYERGRLFGASLKTMNKTSPVGIWGRGRNGPMTDEYIKYLYAFIEEKNFG